MTATVKTKSRIEELNIQVRGIEDIKKISYIEYIKEKVMISIEQIKQMIIKRETEWLQEIHDDDEVQGYIDLMKDEVNECENIDELVRFYTMQGMDLYEGYEAIISILRENTKVEE